MITDHSFFIDTQFSPVPRSFNFFKAVPISYAIFLFPLSQKDSYDDPNFPPGES
jgi:hypothetical protein